MSYDVFKRSFTSSNRKQNRRSEKQNKKKQYIKIKHTNNEKPKTGEKENKGEGLPPNAKNHYNTTANYKKYVYCMHYCFFFIFWFEMTRMGMRSS